VATGRVHALDRLTGAQVLEDNPTTTVAQLCLKLIRSEALATYFALELKGLHLLFQHVLRSPVAKVHRRSFYRVSYSFTHSSPQGSAAVPIAASLQSLLGAKSMYRRNSPGLEPLNAFARVMYVTLHF
jgi:hypothetical protein